MGNLKWAKDQIDRYISENGHKLEAQTAYDIYKNLDIFSSTCDNKIVLDLLNKLNEERPLLKIDLVLSDKDFCIERTYKLDDNSRIAIVVFRSKPYPSLTLTKTYFGEPFDILIGYYFSDINRLSTNFNTDDRFLDIAINDILDEIKPIKIDDYPGGKYDPIPGEWEAELEWKCTYDLDYPDFVRIKYFVNKKRNPKDIQICEVDKYLKRNKNKITWSPTTKEDWDNAETFTDDASDI